MTGAFAQQPQDKIPDKNNTEKKYLLSESPQDKHKKLIDISKKNGIIRVIIKLNTDFNPNLSEEKQVNQRANIKAAQNSLMNSLPPDGIISSHNYKHTPLIAMTVNPASLEQLLSSPLVKSVHEDKINKISLDQTIPIVGADLVFTAGFNGSGQTVAILDTGVDKTHDFFSDGAGGNRIVSEACFTTNITGQGSSSIKCPNGLVSDTSSGSAVPCSHDDCDHGTHVAGIAAGNNLSVSGSEPTRGVANGTNIIAIQVFTVFDGGRICPGQGDCVGAFDSDIIDGLEQVYALRNDFVISSVNLSLGGDAFLTACDDEPHKDAIDMLRTAEIATIISSGNDAFANAIQSPACISTAISVGSTDENDEVPIYSNEAEILDLLAPGGDFGTDTGVTSSVPGNTFEAFTGTSMATPHVTGAYALLREAHPSATVDEILTALKNTGVPIFEPFAGLTKPRIQIEAALSELDNPQTFCGRDIGEFATVITGTSGDDRLSGTSGDDLIQGLEGNDSIKGNGGNDCLIGGDGNDRISGGAGNDFLQGDAGADSLNGGVGDDTLFGGIGDDILAGAEDNDELHGGAGNDSLQGNGGADSLFGDGDSDILSGGDGNDSLDGGAGDDYVLGRGGNDIMIGGAGFDVCVGGAGTDTDATCEIVG